MPSIIALLWSHRWPSKKTSQDLALISSSLLPKFVYHWEVVFIEQTTLSLLPETIFCSSMITRIYCELDKMLSLNVVLAEEASSAFFCYERLPRCSQNTFLCSEQKLCSTFIYWHYEGVHSIASYLKSVLDSLRLLNRRESRLKLSQSSLTLCHMGSFALGAVNQSDS